MVNLDKDIETLAFIDCGASKFTLINKDFAKTLNLSLHKRKISRVVEVINGR